ncbi:MAG: DNA-processing protein DprA [Bacteroidales bacterium]|nr:DNA-processing protein DprA [Bacteroidales bacterium]MCF8387108.1 DNA-processing protein DprA [Bacteroidales bacterium]MCF8397422.1 DNA-processing protein DprA [Bacteroidales bacterium]
MKINNQQLLYQIASTLIPGVGDIVGKKLIDYCGSPEAIFKEKKAHLLKIRGITRKTLNGIFSPKLLHRAEEEIAFIEKYSIQTMFYTKEDYPTRLKQCIDSPLMLYYKGNADLNHQKIISVVGTRSATHYGREIIEDLIAKLKEYNILVISGLAYGIDTLAHKTSLQHGLQTVAVLAHGLDRIYPYLNKNLAEKIARQGGLLTDFMSKTNPDRENFPKRNRIVAGLSDAIVVVESAKKGGALITADIASSYNRDVFAIPGNVGVKYSEGCNFLIKTNRAALIQSADDIIYMMGWKEQKKKKTVQRKIFIELPENERKLLEMLKENDELGIDKICIKSGISATKVASALLNLEFEGLVQCLPGKVYKLV